MKLGFSSEVFLNLAFSSHFALQDDFLYHYKASGFDREDINGNIGIGI